MNELNIPTSNYTFLNNYEEVKSFIEDIHVCLKTLIKYDGLAKGRRIFAK